MMSRILVIIIAFLLGAAITLIDRKTKEHTWNPTKYEEPFIAITIFFVFSIVMFIIVALIRGYILMGV